MDFKIFSSVLAALLAFALIVTVVRSVEQRREEREFYRMLSTVPKPVPSRTSYDDALRKSRLERDRSELSITDGLRMARQKQESPGHD